MTGLRGSDPGEPRIEVLETPEAVSAAAAEWIAERLAAAVGARGRADWATTGGSTPIGIYRVLAEPPLRDDVPWDRVHVWWGDDRFVPRDHPDSNALPLDQVLVRMAAQAGMSGQGGDAIALSARIVAGASIPAQNIHAMAMTPAISAAREPSWVAAEYERELRRANLPLGANGFPSLDLVLVGMGPDGHVLSVFPGSGVFGGEGKGAWVADVPAPTHVEPHVARVSLNPGFLEAAKAVLVVAFGEGKAGVLADVLGEDRDPGRWPVQVARRSNATWLLDAAAAANLRR